MDKNIDVAFRDVILLALAGFVVVVLLLLPHINPPGEQSMAATESPGSVIVEAMWPVESDADIDLWVQAPGDMPVGYSNKGGLYFNLLRDDLGSHYGDVTEINYEVSYSRGMPAGEYVANVHFFRSKDQSFPVPVELTASVKPSPDATVRRVVTTVVRLTRIGQELTAFRFKLTPDGELVPGSVNHVYKPLRAMKGKR